MFVPFPWPVILGASNPQNPKTPASSPPFRKATPSAWGLTKGTPPYWSVRSLVLERLIGSNFFLQVLFWCLTHQRQRLRISFGVSAQSFTVVLYFSHDVHCFFLYTYIYISFLRYACLSTLQCALSLDLNLLRCQPGQLTTRDPQVFQSNFVRFSSSCINSNYNCKNNCSCNGDLAGQWRRRRQVEDLIVAIITLLMNCTNCTACVS